MRTTLNLSDSLINTLMAETGINNKTELIHCALNEMLKKTRRTNIKSMRGSMKLDIDLSEMRKKDMI